MDIFEAAFPAELVLAIMRQLRDSPKSIYRLMCASPYCLRVFEAHRSSMLSDMAMYKRSSEPELWDLVRKIVIGRTRPVFRQLWDTERGRRLEITTLSDLSVPCEARIQGLGRDTWQAEAQSLPIPDFDFRPGSEDTQTVIWDTIRMPAEMTELTRSIRAARKELTEEMTQAYVLGSRRREAIDVLHSVSWEVEDATEPSDEVLSDILQLFAVVEFFSAPESSKYAPLLAKCFPKLGHHLEFNQCRSIKRSEKREWCRRSIEFDLLRNEYVNEIFASRSFFGRECWFLVYFGPSSPIHASLLAAARWCQGIYELLCPSYYDMYNGLRDDFIRMYGTSPRKFMDCTFPYEVSRMRLREMKDLCLMEEEARQEVLTQRMWKSF